MVAGVAATIRAGDIVVFRPQCARLLVTAVDPSEPVVYLSGRNGLADGYAVHILDCEPLRSCSDEEHRRVVEVWASYAMQYGTDSDHRIRFNFEIAERWREQEAAAMMRL